MIKHVPMRKCVICGKNLPKSALLRIVKTSNNDVLFDKIGKLSGRGLYICEDINCVDKAFRSKRIEKLLNVTLKPELCSQIREYINQKNMGVTE
ncbi:RNase P modulator RnpM [Caldicellulosiruptoraceae bacterium PP1]